MEEKRKERETALKIRETAEGPGQDRDPEFQGWAGTVPGEARHFLERLEPVVLRNGGCCLQGVAHVTDQVANRVALGAQQENCSFHKHRLPPKSPETVLRQIPKDTKVEGGTFPTTDCMVSAIKGHAGRPGVKGSKL